MGTAAAATGGGILATLILLGILLAVLLIFVGLPIALIVFLVRRSRAGQQPTTRL